MYWATGRNSGDFRDRKTLATARPDMSASSLRIGTETMRAEPTWRSTGRSSRKASKTTDSAQTTARAIARNDESRPRKPPRPARRERPTLFVARKTANSDSTANDTTAPVDTSPDEKSATIASRGISPNAGRPSAAQSFAASHSPLGRATVTAREPAAAVRAFVHIALAATETDVQRTPCNASTAMAGAKDRSFTSASAEGARKASRTTDESNDRNVAASRRNQTPIALPMT